MSSSSVTYKNNNEGEQTSSTTLSNKRPNSYVLSCSDSEDNWDDIVSSPRPPPFIDSEDDNVDDSSPPNQFDMSISSQSQSVENQQFVPLKLTMAEKRKRDHFIIQHRTLNCSSCLPFVGVKKIHICMECYHYKRAHRENMDRNRNVHKCPECNDDNSKDQEEKSAESLSRNRRSMQVQSPPRKRREIQDNFEITEASEMSLLELDNSIKNKEYELKMLKKIRYLKSAQEINLKMLLNTFNK
jgi:hypothetical protein